MRFILDGYFFRILTSARGISVGGSPLFNAGPDAGVVENSLARVQKGTGDP